MFKNIFPFAILIASASANAQVQITTWQVVSDEKEPTLISHTDYDGLLSLKYSFTCRPPSRVVEIRTYESLEDGSIPPFFNGGVVVNGCDATCKRSASAAFSEEENFSGLEPRRARLEKSTWLKLRPKLVEMLNNGTHFHDLDSEQKAEAISYNMELLSEFTGKCGLDLKFGVPHAGDYGFNWFSPDARCRKITSKDIKSFSKCVPNNDAFGLTLHALSCRVNSKAEIMVYENRSQCQEALETMQANGP